MMTTWQKAVVWRWIYLIFPALLDIASSQESTYFYMTSYDIANNSCLPIQFLITMPARKGAQTLYQAWDTCGSNETLAEFPTSTSLTENLVTFNFKTRTICRHDYASESTECVSGGKRFQVAEVDKGTSMLVMDEPGNEIFWNNGKAGCISFKSLTRDGRVTFPCFETPGIRAEALDTRRKIFFWANTNSEICMKILYEKSSRPSTLKTGTVVSSMTLDIFSKYLYYTRRDTSNTRIYRLPYSSLSNGGQEPLEIISDPPLTVNSIKYRENYIMFTQPASVSVMSLSDLKISVFTNDTSADAVNKLPGGATIMDIFGTSYKRNETRDPCETSKCSDFCFPSIDAINSTCGCSDGSKLGDDEATCYSDSLSTGWIVGMTLLVVSVVAGVAIGVIRCNRDADVQRIKASLMKRDKERAGRASNVPDSAVCLPLPVSYILRPFDVTVDNDTVLGEGHYGPIIKGKYKGKEVAIKTLKSLNFDLDNFIREIKMMAFIGDHPHVVRFHGTVVGRGFFYSVVELSTLGSLKKYLTETMRPASSEGREGGRLDVSVIGKLVTWSEHIAKGMEHFANKRVIHGDLQTKNVLLFPGYVAKVTDSGGHRNRSAEYRMLAEDDLPWRWMDYDALSFFSFSSASDVWAFGVIMWEIFSLGEMPFAQEDWNHEFAEAMTQGRRLPQPEHAPDEIYNQIMMPCWELHRDHRPTFTEIIRRLENYSTQMQCTLVEQVP